MTTKVPAELSSTPSIVDNGNATAITIDSSENVTVNNGTLTSSGANGADNQGFHITDTGYSKTHKIYGDNSLHIQADSSQSILFKPNATEAARFTSDGRLGIGKTDPNYPLVVAGTNPKIQIYDSAGNGQTNLYFGDSGSNLAGYVIYQHSDNVMRFGTDATDRVRIEGGNLNVGGSGDGGKFYVYGDTSGAYLSRFHHDGNNGDRYGLRLIVGADNASTGHIWIRFDDGDGHAQGYMYHDNGSVVINQSDERLKENIIDSPLEGINILKQIQQREFNWKRDTDKTKTIGYIAQELETVYPAAVVAVSDKSGDGVVAPDDDPDNPYKFVAKDRLIDVLIKATQEQQDIIDNLKARIETLEAG